ncbi:meiotic nuclear division protein 1, partial [Zychaea mexicana]|uniref:meiotic nuclear division protein 1 n=1 Tax=Zychaea mexicana TaxID=64656 RepID=UPI0022FE160E
SKKGLSLEEKRKRLEDSFHESGEFYQLKEIEKMGQKKGVVLQSVKEVLQGLVDDGLVTTDKIGTSNYFWSFPSTAANAVQNERDKKEQLQKAIEEARSGREPTPERDEILQKYHEALRLKDKLQDELKQYVDNDPETYRAKEKAAVIAKEAANRWTENIWTIEGYCVNKLNANRQEIEQMFGIDSELDTFP